ncbi:P-loop containing nucleoside triphosphate hydrolase protein [Amanita rubescens]|nr:P-loop containing nucleoside triphosphate hydrolase protein [Amanita rubescens]
MEADSHDRFQIHQKCALASQKLLDDTWTAASSSMRSRDSAYSSELTRGTITREFEQRMNGLKPYYWRLDVAEALILGLDCIVIAGTGAGKSMPFVMPLFAFPDKMVIILSPLNALEEDQAVRFSGIGLKAVAVNGDTYSKDIHKKLEKRHYNVIITSPEMCLEHVQFCSLLNSNAFVKNILALVVDEAHCISQWGDKFRKSYADLGTLRTNTCDFGDVATHHSCTGSENPPHGLGIDIPSKSDLESLSFLISLDEDGNVISFRQTLIFFDDIKVSLQALKWFRERIPESLHLQIAAYSSRRSTNSKKIVLRDFRDGKIKILLTTEAAGMGCDMPHIEQVVQFLVPSLLSIWMQWAGRAGRSPDVQARAILLVQPTVFQVVKPRKESKQGEGNDDDNNDADVKYRKDIEEGLRRWIEGLECRREVVSLYFNDGVPHKEPTGDCCDNCLRRLGTTHDLMQFPLANEVKEVKDEPIDAVTSFVGASTSRKRSATGIIKLEGSETSLNGPKTRRDQFRQGAIQLLESWRLQTYEAHYLRRPWGPHCLLPDNILSSLASKRTITTVQDLIGEGWSATHAQKHGLDVLKCLADYDLGHFKDLEEKREEKKRETEERRALEAQEAKRRRAEAKAIRQAQPKPPPPPGHGLMSASSLQPGLMPPPVLAGLMPSPVIPQSQSAFPGLMHSPVISQPLVQGLPGHYYYQPGHYHYYQQPGSQPYHLQPQALYHQQYHYIPHYSQPQNQPQNQSHLPGDWGQNPN